MTFEPKHFYTWCFDEGVEDYPYWVGVNEQSFNKHYRPKGHEDWCTENCQRGFHHERTSDSVVGTHIRYQFLSRTDAMRFILHHDLGPILLRD